MTYIEKMQRELGVTNIPYLRLLQRYRSDSTTFFGFVEGKTDVPYYTQLIDGRVDGIEMDIQQVGIGGNKGGKQKVIDLYNIIDWTTFNKNRVLFFIDRDLTEIIAEDIPEGENIYITDDYSIENNIVEPYTCRRVLKEQYGMGDLDKGIMDKLIDDFKSQKMIFCEQMSLIMANIIYWKKHDQIDKPNYNNIDLDKIYKFQNCILTNILNEDELVKIIYHHSQVDYDDYHDNDATQALRETFLSNNHHRRFIRGKYLMWFFEEFCKSACKDAKNIDYIKKKIKFNTINSNDFFSHVVLRCKIPSSLKAFIEYNRQKVLGS